MLNDSIDPEYFRTIKKEYELERVKAEQRLIDIGAINNIEPPIEKSIDVLVNIDMLYLEGTSKTKNNIIGSIFPGKLEFDEVHFRTTRIN